MTEARLVHDLDERVHLVERDFIFVLRLIGGYLLIIVGVFGLFIPVMPDLLLVVFGIILLDAHGGMRRRILHWFPERWRKYARRILFWGQYHPKTEEKNGKH